MRVLMVTKYIKMNKIIFCKGLPASGKTTWSKQYCKDNNNFVRLNKDDLREELQYLNSSNSWNKAFEDLVLNTQRLRGCSLLKEDKSIIIDDTNYEISGIFDYTKYLSSQIKRLEKIDELITKSEKTPTSRAIANVNGKSAAVVCSTGHASAIVPVNRPLLSNNGVAQKAQFQSACLEC